MPAVREKVKTVKGVKPHLNVQPSSGSTQEGVIVGRSVSREISCMEKLTALLTRYCCCCCGGSSKVSSSRNAPVNAKSLKRTSCEKFVRVRPASSKAAPKNPKISARYGLPVVEEQASRRSRDVEESKSVEIEAAVATPAKRTNVQIIAEDVSLSEITAPPSSWKDLQILFIEDTPSNLKLFMRVAVQMGIHAPVTRKLYSVQEAGKKPQVRDLFQRGNVVFVRTGDLALELLKRKGRCFHAVVSDEMIMGKPSSGLQVIKKYREWEKAQPRPRLPEELVLGRLPVVYFSANSPTSLDKSYKEVMEGSVRKVSMSSFREMFGLVGSLMQTRYPSFNPGTLSSKSSL